MLNFLSISSKYNLRVKLLTFYGPCLLLLLLLLLLLTMGNKIAIFQLFYSMVLIYDILHIFPTIYESVIFSFFWSICHALYKNLTIV